MSVFRSYPMMGLLAGLTVPPIATKFILQPYFVDSKYDEIDAIKHDLDHMGWLVRNLEEIKGLPTEEVYVPVSYFQARY